VPPQRIKLKIKRLMSVAGSVCHITDVLVCHMPDVNCAGVVGRNLPVCVEAAAEFSA